MKGMLFTKENRQLTRDGKKIQTRRVIIPQPKWEEQPSQLPDGEFVGRYQSYNNENMSVEVDVAKPRYQIGEIIYMKEPYRLTPGTCSHAFNYDYKDDYSIEPLPNGFKWKTLFMPEKAARTFLLVAGIKVERVSQISKTDVIAEGLVNGIILNDNPNLFPACYSPDSYAHLWDEINAKWKPVKKNGKIIKYECYPWFESIPKIPKGKDPAMFYTYPNPWVFAYTYKLVEKQKLPATQLEIEGSK